MAGSALSLEVERIAVLEENGGADDVLTLTFRNDSKRSVSLGKALHWSCNYQDHIPEPITVRDNGGRDELKFSNNIAKAHELRFHLPSDARVPSHSSRTIAVRVRYYDLARRSPSGALQLRDPVYKFTLPWLQKDRIRYRGTAVFPRSASRRRMEADGASEFTSRTATWDWGSAPSIDQYLYMAAEQSAGVLAEAPRVVDDAIAEVFGLLLKSAVWDWPQTEDLRSLLAKLANHNYTDAPPLSTESQLVDKSHADRAAEFLRLLNWLRRIRLSINENSTASSDSGILQSTSRLSSVNHATNAEPEELQAQVLKLIWERYAPKREWPARKDFRILLRNLSIDFETAQRTSGVIISDDVARATFDALLIVPDFRRLFEPLPALLRLASRRFCAAPDYQDGKDTPVIIFSDLTELWPDEKHTKLASDVLWDTQFRLLSSSNLKADPRFRPALECLRFGNIQTIEDYERTLLGPRASPIVNPSGATLELLHVVHTHVKREGRWPNPTKIAVEQNDRLGYVPELVEQLQPEFIKGDYFPRQRHDELVLTLRSLELLDPGALKLLPAIIRTVAALWEELPSNSTESIPLSAIAERTRISIRELRGVVRYLESEPWYGGGSYPTWLHPEYEWKVRPIEQIDEFRNVASWEDYCGRRSRLQGLRRRPGEPLASKHAAMHPIASDELTPAEDESVRSGRGGAGISDSTGVATPDLFHSSADLLERLTSERDRKIVFMLGSGLSLPCLFNGPGVPSSDGVIGLIREEVPDLPATLPYSTSFKRLIAVRGQDAANRIVRRAVLKARTMRGDLAEKAEAGDFASCEALEDDLEGWWLPQGVESLGKLAARHPHRFHTVLTTNFDPLLRIAIRRAGGRPAVTIMDRDGRIDQTVVEGERIVHLHGHWYQGDTLHADLQLRNQRPSLQASLRKLLEGTVVVVLGYGGWDDVFMRSLGHLDSTDVLWGFFAHQPVESNSSSEHILRELQPLLTRGRAVLYAGVDANSFLPTLELRTPLTSPASPRITTQQILLAPPPPEQDQFETLVADARSSLEVLQRPSRTLIYCQLASREPPADWEFYEAFGELAEAARQKEVVGTNGMAFELEASPDSLEYARLGRGVRLNENHSDVARALVALKRVASFLTSASAQFVRTYKISSGGASPNIVSMEFWQRHLPPLETRTLPT